MGGYKDRFSNKDESTMRHQRRHQGGFYTMASWIHAVYRKERRGKYVQEAQGFHVVGYMLYREGLEGEGEDGGHSAKDEHRCGGLAKGTAGKGIAGNTAKRTIGGGLRGFVERWRRGIVDGGRSK